MQTAMVLKTKGTKMDKKDWKLKFIEGRIDEEMLNDCPKQKPLEANLKRIKELGEIADAIFDTANTKALKVHADDYHHYEMPYIKIDFQEGPVKEVGDNGCQNEDVIQSVLLHRMRKLQEAFPCIENEEAIVALENALSWLKKRTQKRVEQGVEGENKPHTS